MNAESLPFYIPQELNPTADELPGKLKEIAEIVGVDNALKLAHAFDGCWVYINSVDSLLRAIRDRGIRYDYDNGLATVLELARKNGLSERQIRRILSGMD